MPLAHIYAPSHIAMDKLQQLAKVVQAGLVATCHVPINDLFQLIVHMPANAMIMDPNFGKVDRSNDALIVQITFLVGRTDAQKKNLYQHIAEGAVASGFRSDDIMITLVENSKMDWSLGRGLAYADVAQT